MTAGSGSLGFCGAINTGLQSAMGPHTRDVRGGVGGCRKG